MTNVNQPPANPARFSHVAVRRHVPAGHAEAQILDFDRRSRMIVGSHVPIGGMFVRAWDALKKIGKPRTEEQKVVDAAKAATALKKRAKDVQNDLRCKIAPRHASCARRAAGAAARGPQTPKPPVRRSPPPPPLTQ